MAGIAAIFIADSRRRLAATGVWLVIFVLMIGVSAWVAQSQIGKLVDEEASEELHRFTQLKRNVISTFEFMHAEMTAQPCTPAFHEQLRIVAYLPDGLNEFFYAPGGVAHCSVNVPHFDEPVDFGTPDIAADANSGRSVWVDRDLGFVGLPGHTGTLVASEPFATVVPPQSIEPSVPSWARVEMGLWTGSRWWHRAGSEGVHDRYLAARQAGGLAGMLSLPLYRMYCDEDGLHCVVVELDYGGIIREMLAPILLALLGAVALASWSAHAALRRIRQYWSFEARFLRHFGPETMVCTYQPILQVSDGRICGCEVLVRWRDLDGTIVSPDRFLPIVERNGLTFRLTRIVVDKAFDELSRHVPEDHPLQISFNIFPRDLDHGKLIPLLGRFLAEPGRFSPAVEIIESEAMPLASAQAEIEALLAAGVVTHIDDFGVGYSNIHNLAALSVHAVKLDRAFAMAPEGSMLDRMLLPAISMIRTCGHLVCVEGVENAERLELLSKEGIGADFIQGYHLSKPLSVEEFSRFILEFGDRSTGLRKAA
jgi:sensor c-di-GMP phosphodiesterase-like protein